MRPTPAQEKREAYTTLEVDSNPSAAAVVRLLRKHEHGAKQAQLLENIYCGEVLITEEAVQSCEEAFMQLRQLLQVVERHSNLLVGEPRDAARLVSAELVSRVNSASNHINQIRLWSRD